MRRIAQVIAIEPSAIQEYRRIHQSVWPAVLKQIHRSNIRNYSIYLHGELLFAYFEYVGDDFEGDMAAMAADSETQRWWQITMPMQRPLGDDPSQEWWLPLEEIFHID